MGDVAVPRQSRCARCNCELGPRLLSCPSCGRLVHADTLKTLAEEARLAEAEGRLAEALDAWRRVLALLPPIAQQHEVVQQTVATLSQRVANLPLAHRLQQPKPTKEPGKGKLAGAAAGLGTVGLILWKLKFAVIFLLTKGKLLLLGLTKASTLLSMFASLGVYWSIWGWKFAAGLVASIYVHEMGHVAALRRFGVKASAPMFIPGFGALIRLKQVPTTPTEDARIGLAGPTWGLFAALATFGVYLATGWQSWGAIARVAAWINLFNLAPIWQLDGARGFHAMARWQRWLCAAVIAGMWMLTAESMLMLVLIFAVLNALAAKPKTADHRAMIEYVFLTVTLSALCAFVTPQTAAALG